MKMTMQTPLMYFYLINMSIQMTRSRATEFFGDTKYASMLFAGCSVLFIKQDISIMLILHPHSIRTPDSRHAGVCNDLSTALR